jgi:hypothetical protein
MKFGQLELNPAENPGVLDTGTWHVATACAQVRAAKYDWSLTAAAFRQRVTPQTVTAIKIWNGSVAVTENAVWFLVELADGQTVILWVGSIDPSVSSPLGGHLEEWILSNRDGVRIYSTDAAVLDRYCRLLVPEKGPRALGLARRLGVGTRMTTQVWPGIFEAMTRCDMATNAIQNSIRELSLLDDLLAARPPETNYSTGIGTIQAGWTGSTYEGLWVAGVLAALKYEHPLRYGADADHVQVKRGIEGVERAKRVIRAARYYSFYTLDMADVLNYSALSVTTESDSAAFLVQKITNMEERARVLTHHMQQFTVAGRVRRLDPITIGRFVGKYWDALDIVGELAGYIASLKDGVPFDLELTIDEHPPEVGAFDCLTSDDEVLFLALEIKRRALPISHLAPNFGQEKGTDYRGPDGLAGLEQRARTQFEIAAKFGLMLDVHSGDDLSKKTRQVFGRASEGRVHFKVSPMLQLIYAEILQKYHPDLFRRWWDDALAYAQREAAKGSTVAQECLAEWEAKATTGPSTAHRVFHYYSFPFVGRRDERGQFLNRTDFYRLSPAFYQAYQQCIAEWLGELAEDLFQNSSNPIPHAALSR